MSTTQVPISQKYVALGPGRFPGRLTRDRIRRTQELVGAKMWTTDRC